MSIIKKMKDILFDEEEVIIEKPAPKNEVPRERVIEKTAPVVEQIKVPQVEKKLEDTKELPSPFIDFDEDEFVNSIPHVPSEPKRSELRSSKEVRPAQKPLYSGFERKTTIEKKVDYGRYEKTESIEIKEKRKFKPSLIISPVYGVLNEDYIPDDIKSRDDFEDVLNIDDVRKKAYGNLDKLEKTIDEPVETFFEEKVKVSVKPVYESSEKVKTIDELLSISADEEIDIKESLLEDENNFSMTEELRIPEVKDEVLYKESIIEDEEDTLENDLFDLIDSMYESKEEVF